MWEGTIRANIMPDNLTIYNIKIRMLNADEFNREDLVNIFVENESSVPNPLNSTIQVAEDKDGKIVGFAVLQPQYHAEPIYVDKHYRNTQLHSLLIHRLLSPFNEISGLRVFVFAPNGKIARLCEKFGFKKKEYEVFIKEF